MSFNISFEPQPQPQLVYFGPQPQPQRPMTTGEMIFVGIILVLFIGLFIWAAATGNLQQTQPRPHPHYYPETLYPGTYYYRKTHFTNPQTLPLADSYPFGDVYNPELFSSGCCS